VLTYRSTLRAGSRGALLLGFLAPLRRGADVQRFDDGEAAALFLLIEAW
jgi:hypothetical protein